MKLALLAGLNLIVLTLVACTDNSTANISPDVQPSPAAIFQTTTITPTPIPATSLPSPTLIHTTTSSSTATPIPPTASPVAIAATPTVPSPTATATLSTLDFTQGAWRIGTSMPRPARSELPAVTLGDWVYVPGGFGGESRLERYHPQTGQWETLANMPDGRHHLMATAYNNFLYVLGGAQAQSWIPSDTVWRYNPTENQWLELDQMPELRSAGVAVTLDNTIYIIGGVGGSEDMLALSPEDGTWQALPGPNQPREHVSAVAFQGEIWLLGGRWPGVGELSTVEIYNPIVETWRNGPAMNVARAGFTAAVVNEHIMAAGGEVIFNGTETLDSVEIFAPDSTAWQLGPRLPIAIHGVGGAAFEQSFLLLGGSLRAGAIENEGQVQIYSP